MKPYKNSTLTIFSFLTLTLSAAIFQGCKMSTEETSSVTEVSDGTGIPPLLERKGELAKTAEWQKIKARVAELRQKVIANPSDLQSRLQVAMIYISEARITGNSDYYQSIYAILDRVLQIDPNNFESYVFKASVKMSQHQFAQAKEMAEKARTINPDNAYVYGVLVDANVELGDYKQAIAMSDKMQSLKPSLESYSRASYLREIHGDYLGAIEAMKLAVEAGAPGLESTEWARVALGDLYLNTGMLKEAEAAYNMSLSYRADFPNAEIGIAKVFKAKRDYTSAITHTEKAIRLVSETAYVSQLAELYELQGNTAKAADIRKDIVDLTEKAEKEQPKDKALAHNGNRELATAYMNNKQYDKALSFALNDLKLRPSNIDANELVGWLYFLKGDQANAKLYIDNALKTNTRNANTLLKAAAIYTKAGDGAKGNLLYSQAKTVNAYADNKLLIAAN